MSRERPLSGACACGRNRYTVEVPPDSEQTAQVFFDNSGNHRRHHASPLTAFLRVPLTWYHSTTYSFFPDEVHSSIRRMYTSPSTPSAKRQFCGYCGTPLSYWNEDPPSEADFISVTLGSLTSTDLHDLEELGLLPSKAVESAEQDREIMGAFGGSAASGEDLQITTTGVPWFQMMIEGSRLASLSQTRRRSSRETYNDGVTVEWEIVEVDDPGDAGSAKRKIGEVDPQERKGDVEMGN
ncbi:MAG: hypothetical protein M4579_004918 [Chaenotheca gracillima]|nr:MAG: hypothetical protein M4579_004918 [Chaenotheca gracillima]